MNIAQQVMDHRFAGACPDVVNGWESRDPECLACRTLNRYAEAAAEALMAASDAVAGDEDMVINVALGGAPYVSSWLRERASVIRNENGEDEMTEQTVKIGQVWRRKRDGMMVRITAYRAPDEDCGWREVDGKRRGQIFAYNLFNRYELMGEADD